MLKKKNVHRSPVKRHYFNLPDDLQEVKTWAFAQGIMNAFHAWPRRPLADEPHFIGAAALEAAFLIEKKVIKGKQGCNEPVQFRKTFADLCALIHPAATVLFERYPETYKKLLGFSEEERVAAAHVLAEQYLLAVEQLIERGEPIEFPM